MKKICMALFALILITEPTQTVYGEIEKPSVVAQGAVLMEMETGRVLWGKNENEPMAMASTTKIMTAILAIESGKLDETVVASKRAASAPKVRMNLQIGEEHRLEDLLYPLMLQSSNDAAIAIAEHVGGSVEGFCQMMTEKAKELGAEDTIFESPNGLDVGNHHSTAKDMALITRYALNNEKFIQITNTPSITIPIRSEDAGKQKTYTVVNHNRLLNEYEGAIGVKTGFTGKAGQCFVGAAKRDDMTLISVVLASGWGTNGKEQKWKDSKALLNYGFQNYNNSLVVKSGDAVDELVVPYSREGSVELIYKDDVMATLTEEEKNNLKIEISTPEYVEAPISRGQKIGVASVYIGNGEICGQSDIIANMDIARHDFETSLRKIIDSWLNIGKEGIL